MPTVATDRVADHIGLPQHAGVCYLPIQKLEKISPSNNVDKIKKPLLVLQGLNDPRVPASESEQIVQALREAGGEAWYLLAKDEGHGFRKKANREAAFQVTVQFLSTYLLN